MMRASVLVGLTACSYTPPNAISPPIDTPIDNAPIIDAVDPDGPPIDGPPAEPISLIRTKVGQHADSTHDSISVTIKQTGGHANIAVVSWYTPTANLDTLTDTAGNTYTMAGEVSDGTIVERIYIAIPIAAADANVVTAQFSANAQFCEIRLIEFAGLAASPLDQIASATGFSATPSVGPVTTTHANDSLLGVFTGSVMTAGTGYVQRISFNGDFVEERRPNVIGTFSATAAGMNGEFVAQLVALRGAL